MCMRQGTFVPVYLHHPLVWFDPYAPHHPALLYIHILYEPSPSDAHACRWRSFQLPCGAGNNAGPGK